MVGLIPLFAVETLDSELLDRMPSFKRRMEWFIENRHDLTANLACMRTTGQGERRLLSIVDAEKLRRILKYMLDENEFLSPYGIRALSRHHEANPYVLNVGGVEHRVDYEPGESRSGLFGGNSNWRGPIWFPMNFLLVEALQRFHYYLGDDFKVECPTELRPVSDIVGGGGGAVAPDEQHLHPRRRRPKTGLWRHRQVPVRRELERPHPVPRVLPWRHRGRHRRQSPDRMDRAGRKAHATKRRKEITIGGRSYGRSCRLTKETNTK